MSSTASSPSAPAEGGLLPEPNSLDGSTTGEVLVTAPVVDPMAEYRRLQKRLLLFTLGLSAFAVILAWWRFSSSTALSVAIGSVGSLVYLFLLSRSVEKLGGTNKQVGKIQLLVPVALVLLSTRWPLMQLFPALIGFLIYKPAVIISTAFDLWIEKPSE